MNHNTLYRLAALFALLGLLFVSFGGGLLALAQEGTPEPRDFLPDASEQVDVITDMAEVMELAPDALNTFKK